MKGRRILLLSIAALLLSGCAIDDGTVETSLGSYSFSVDDNPGSYSYPDPSSNPTPSTSSGTSRPTPSSSKPSSSNSIPTWSSDSSQSQEPVVPVTPANVRYASPDMPESMVIEDLKIVEDDSYYSSLAIYLAEREMASLGLNVFRAFAIIPDETGESEEPTHVLPGIAFSDGSLYSIDEEGNSYYSCGFMQLVEGEAEYVLTPEIAATGIAVVPQDGSDTRFIIESNAFVDGFSGLSNGHYFSYKQTAPFVITVSSKKVGGPVSSYADEDLDLYDYDNQEDLYQASIFRGSTIGAYAIYGKAALAYKNAIAALNEAIRVQEENGLMIALNSFVVFDMDCLTADIANLQEEFVGIDGFELAQNQYIVATEDGYKVVTDNSYESARNARGFSGLLKTLTGAALTGSGAMLMVAGAAAFAACPVLGAMMLVSGGTEVLFGAADCVEGAQDIIAAATGKIDLESANPIKNLFAQMFGDEEAGEKAYHFAEAIVGLTSSFYGPINMAFQAASGLSGSFSTAISVGRAIAVHACKIGITTLVAVGAGKFAQKAASDLGLGEIASQIVGIGVGMLAGFLVYRGLDKIDRSLNLSGFSKTRPVSLQEIEEEKARMRINRTGDTDVADGQPALYKERNYYSKKVYTDDTVSRLSAENNVKLKYGTRFFDETNEPFFDYFPSMRHRDAGPRKTLVAGFVDYATKTIYLDFSRIKDDGVLMLRTVAHLVRHLHQFEAAEFDSPVMKALREENYVGPDGPARAYLSNAAEQDAEAYADYIQARSEHAYEVRSKNPDVTYVENIYSFEDPSTYKAG